MTIVMRPSCWHQNLGPNGLSAPAQGLYLNFFSSVTADFNISSALRWAIQDQGSSGYYGVRQWLYYLIGASPSRTELLHPILVGSRGEEPNQVVLLVIFLLLFQVFCLSAAFNICVLAISWTFKIACSSSATYWCGSCPGCPELGAVGGCPVDQVNREVKFPAICHYGKRYFINLYAHDLYAKSTIGICSSQSFWHGWTYLLSISINVLLSLPAWPSLWDW